MWLDETFSVWLASQSVADMLHWIARIDQHPPLYYLLLHFWITINGAAPYYVRLLSVVFGTATIPVIYVIGKRISGTVVGLAAAALLAFSPFNIYFAQETRMYTLLTFNAAVAIYALVRLLTDRGRSSRSAASSGSTCVPGAGRAGGSRMGRENSATGRPPRTKRDGGRWVGAPSLVAHPDDRDRPGVGWVHRVLGCDPAHPQHGGLFRCWPPISSCSA